MQDLRPERQIRDEFRRAADRFRRCLQGMGYEQVKVPYPLDVLENKDFKTTFVIDYGERPASSMNIRMKAKGVWTNIYVPYTAKEREARALLEKEIPPAEKMYDETGELIMCEQCGCVDFVRRGEEYLCSICCKTNTD